jgi:hypothetical protein
MRKLIIISGSLIALSLTLFYVGREKIFEIHINGKANRFYGINKLGISDKHINVRRCKLNKSEYSDRVSISLNNDNLTFRFSFHAKLNKSDTIRFFANDLKHGKVPDTFFSFYNEDDQTYYAPMENKPFLLFLNTNTYGNLLNGNFSGMIYATGKTKKDSINIMGYINSFISENCD